MTLIRSWRFKSSLAHLTAQGLTTIGRESFFFKVQSVPAPQSPRPVDHLSSGTNHPGDRRQQSVLPVSVLRNNRRFFPRSTNELVAAFAVILSFYTMRRICQLAMRITTIPQIQVGTIRSGGARKSFPQLTQ